jgi:polysaccharide biosynthesis/export protein
VGPAHRGVSLGSLLLGSLMTSKWHAFRWWQSVALTCLALTLPAFAQDTSGTDVMQVFRSMSPNEQQQVMQQIGVGQATGAGGANSALASEQAAREQDLEAMRFRLQLQQREQLEQRLPILRPEDWVVIEADTTPLPPRPTDTSEALYRSLITGTLTSSYPAYPGSPPSSSAAIANPLAQFSNLSSMSQGGSQVSPSQLQQYQQYQQQQQSGQTSDQQSQVPGQSAGQSTGEVSQALTGGWQFGPPSLMTPPDPQQLAQLVALIRSKNPYQLTRDGVLNLPGFAGIRMGGLSDVQATLRLEVEPAMRGLFFRVTKLPLAKEGAAGLRPFGYDLFAYPPSTFAPGTNVPVPSSYIVGPGDVLEVDLYGNENHSYTLEVGRDGRVNFPQIGPIAVGGGSFSSVKEQLESRVARQMIGVKASVSMDQTRAIRIFVLGEAQEPGSYSVSGLATMTSALYAAGGIRLIGSLRDIQLKRQGQVVRHLDLYDLLIRGDTTDDAKLLPGDVVFVPPIGPTASIDGEVHRPAIYEMRHETTLGDLVQLAGGLTPDAEPNLAWLTRIDSHELREVLRVDLSSGPGRSQSLHNGDELRVMRLVPTLDSGVTLAGHVYSPGNVAYRAGMRLTDVIHSIDDLQPNADLHYVLIRRELPPDRRIEAFSADLGAALVSPGGPADVSLMPRDRVIVFDLESGRDRIIQPLLEELRLQSHFDRPTDVVQVQGRVKVPGEYPLEPGMRVSDLIRAGGYLTDAAYGGRGELARYAVINGEERQIELIPVDLVAALRGDPKADIKLEPFDTLSVKQLSLWGEQNQVTLLGQVRFPGVYTIREGETLRSVVERAGGLTEYAFPEGSVFTRVELKQREQEQLDMLARRTQSDIAAMALEATAGSAISGNGGGGSAGANALVVGQGLLTQLKAARAVGRLVIDLPRLMREPQGSQDDVILRRGDMLIVPKFEQEVTVIGEVQSNTSLLYRKNQTRDDYINLSGGMTQHADPGKIYVVRANGSVVPGAPAHFFRVGSSGVAIRPGDTIVVPMNTEKLPALPEWQAITGIIYNLAIGAAAIHAVGV